MSPDGLPITKISSGLLGRYRLYQTKDNQWISLAALEDKFWNNFCTLIDRPHWINHGSYPDVDPSIHRELEDMFMKKTKQEWTEWANHHDICLTPVLSSHEVLASTHFQKRKLFFTIKKGSKKIYFPKTPYVTRSTQIKKMSPAPLRGEHGREILKGCGFTMNQIKQFEKEGYLLKP